MIAPSEQLVLLDEIPGQVAVHRFQNVLISCWPTVSNPTSVRMLADIRSRYLPAHPEGVSLIHIGADPSVPDDATSAAWVDMMRRHADRVHCIAVVMPARGFRASLMRSWVTEKRMLQAPGEFKMRFHTDVDELMAWLPTEHTARTGVQLSYRALQKHLHQLIDATVGPASASGAS